MCGLPSPTSTHSRYLTMSHSAASVLNAGAPDALSLLHQRLLTAEAEAEALIQDMDMLGVSRDQILGSVSKTNPAQRPVSPLKIRWALGDEGILSQLCDSLVSRMCRMESLLQSVKLTIFRLETERELDPSCTAHLKQQLAALQQESEQEQQVSRKEVMKLKDQLHQAYQERDEARTELQRLGETLEAATAAKMDVALAAEELKIVKLEMSQKLTEMKEQIRQESARYHEAVKSHSELLRRFEETQRVAELERRHVVRLQLDCQTSRQRLQEERDRTRQLEEHCQQLKEQTAMKDSLVSELKTDVKRQQNENSKLVNEGRELRAAADRVQTLNKQLQSQCSQLSSALCSLTAENKKQQSEHQASSKAERNRVVMQLQEQDLLLEAAKRNIQTELQVALSHKVSLQLELERLKGEHAQLLQSSSVAQETTATQRELLERTIERLRGELSMAKKEKEEMRKDLKGSKNELCLVVTKLESERSALETQLSEAKREVGSLSSALQRLQDENKRLMGKVAVLEHQQHVVQQADRMLKDLSDNKNKPAYEEGKLKISELEALPDACGSAWTADSQTLQTILASQTRLDRQTVQQVLGGREQELAALKKDRMQAQREIRKHQTEVEKLQQLLSSTHSKNNRALESLESALDTAKMDNKRLAKSLEHAVSTNNSLQSRLEQARDQYQAAILNRDEQLHEARMKISHLSEELGNVKQQATEDYKSSMKTLHREISELKMSVKDSSSRSGDLSTANKELCQQVSELGRLLSKQKAFIREKSQLRQRKTGPHLQDSSQKVKLKSVCQGDRRHASDMSAHSPGSSRDGAHTFPEHDPKVLNKQEAGWERWTSAIQRWEAKRELARVTGGYK